jgi:hypothetical protein
VRHQGVGKEALLVRYLAALSRATHPSPGTQLLVAKGGDQISWKVGLILTVVGLVWVVPVRSRQRGAMTGTFGRDIPEVLRSCWLFHLFVGVDAGVIQVGDPGLASCQVSTQTKEKCHVDLEVLVSSRSSRGQPRVGKRSLRAQSTA